MGWTFPMFYTTVSYLLLLLSQAIYCNVDVIHNDNVIKTFDYEAAEFGGTIPDEGIQGQLIYLQPKRNGSCHDYEPIPVRLGPNDTWIALMKRRGCKFVHMVLAAQKMNYSAVIVHNNESYGNELFIMDGPTENNQYEDEIVIPSVFVGYDDGLTLRRYDFGRITRNPVTTVEVPWTRTTRKQVQEDSVWKTLWLWTILSAPYVVVFVPIFVLRRIAAARMRRERETNIDQVQSNTATYIPMEIPSNNYSFNVRSAKFTIGDRYNECPICLEDFVDEENLSMLPCDHQFHIKCFKPCLQMEQPKCPVCRRLYISLSSSDFQV